MDEETRRKMRAINRENAPKNPPAVSADKKFNKRSAENEVNDMPSGSDAIRSRVDSIRGMKDAPGRVNKKVRDDYATELENAYDKRVFTRGQRH